MAKKPNPDNRAQKQQQSRTQTDVQKVGSQQKKDKHTDELRRKFRKYWIIYTVLGAIIVPGFVILRKVIEGYTIDPGDVVADFVLMVYALLINLFWCGIANLLKKEEKDFVPAMLFSFFTIIFCVVTYFTFFSPINRPDISNRWFWFFVSVITIIWLLDLKIHSKIESDF